MGGKGRHLTLPEDFPDMLSLISISGFHENTQYFTSSMVVCKGIS